MTIVYSCLCFVSISRGLMTKPVGFLRVPPLKFVEQIVWFFSFLISLLFGPFFSVYICVWFYLLQSHCSNGYFSRTSFVNFSSSLYILLLLLLVSKQLQGSTFSFDINSEGIVISKLVSQLKLLSSLFELEDNDTIVMSTIRKDCKVFFTFTSQQMPKVTASFLLWST